MEIVGSNGGKTWVMVVKVRGVGGYEQRLQLVLSIRGRGRGKKQKEKRRNFCNLFVHKRIVFSFLLFDRNVLGYLIGWQSIFFSQLTI